MKSAWSHVRADYVLFIPCDVTYIPTQVVAKLHSALRKNKQAQAAYVSINGDALYPFCLLKRESLEVLEQQIDKQQLSLKIALNFTCTSSHFSKAELIFP